MKEAHGIGKGVLSMSMKLPFEDSRAFIVESIIPPSRSGCEATVIDCAFGPAPAETAGAVSLRAGRHPFRLYWQCAATAPRLDLSGPSIPRQPIPATRLFHE